VADATAAQCSRDINNVKLDELKLEGRMYLVDRTGGSVSLLRAHCNPNPNAVPPMIQISPRIGSSSSSARAPTECDHAILRALQI
jgi:hypothetical protein